MPVDGITDFQIRELMIVANIQQLIDSLDTHHEQCKYDKEIEGGVSELVYSYLADLYEYMDTIVR